MSNFTEWAAQQAEEEWAPDDELVTMAQYCIAFPWCSPEVYWNLTHEERDALSWEWNRQNNGRE